jgi:AraC family transcriptional regulator, regulatory protein of adaptative response / methylated-DNA-[protein]-cysteine methyltransferase
LDQTITLDTLAEVSGLSAHHLQETFKRIVGLSPKAFCDAQRIMRFKQLLRAGRSISDACYEVGYGSSRALYEKARKGLGMTPSVYRRRGVGIHIGYAVMKSALGRVLVARTDRGVCSVLVCEHDAALIRELRQEFPAAVLLSTHSVTWEAVQHGQDLDPLLLKLPLAIRRRIFMARIWNYLQ